MMFRVVCELEMTYTCGDESDSISRRYEYAGEKGLLRFLYMMEQFDGRTFAPKNGEGEIVTKINRIMVIREFKEEEAVFESVTHVKLLLRDQFGNDEWLKG